MHRHRHHLAIAVLLALGTIGGAHARIGGARRAQEAEKKLAPNSPGGEDYCEGRLCAYGEGDCDGKAEQCAGILVCGRNNGKEFGLQKESYEACICPSSMEWNGSACVTAQSHKPGGVGYCTPDNHLQNGAKCSYGEGDCDGDVQCAGNLVCGDNNGKEFGLAKESYEACICPSGLKWTPQSGKCETAKLWDDRWGNDNWSFPGGRPSPEDFPTCPGHVKSRHGAEGDTCDDIVGNPHSVTSSCGTLDMWGFNCMGCRCGCAEGEEWHTDHGSCVAKAPTKAEAAALLKAATAKAAAAEATLKAAEAKIARLTNQLGAEADKTTAAEATLKAAEEKMGAEITRLANEVDSSSAAVDTLKERNAKAQAAVQALRAEKDMLAQTAADEKASANAALSAEQGKLATCTGELGAASKDLAAARKRRGGFELVAEKQECDGSEENVGFISLDECAARCKGEGWQRFIFGRAGSSRCNSDGTECVCFCETVAPSACKRKESPHYNLYKE